MEPSMKERFPTTSPQVTVYGSSSMETWYLGITSKRWSPTKTPMIRRSTSNLTIRATLEFRNQHGKSMLMRSFDTLTHMIRCVVTIMMMFESVAHSTIFARNWFSWIASVQLNVYLRMSRADLYSSLHRQKITTHLATELSTYTTGTLWIKYSPLLRWVYTDFWLVLFVPSESDLEFARCCPWALLFFPGTLREYCWQANFCMKRGRQELWRESCWVVLRWLSYWI